MPDSAKTTYDYHYSVINVQTRYYITLKQNTGSDDADVILSWNEVEMLYYSKVI